MSLPGSTGNSPTERMCQERINIACSTGGKGNNSSISEEVMYFTL